MSFNREVTLTIQENGQQAQLIQDLRISFVVTKTNKKEPNEIKITVWNLSRETFNKVKRVDNIAILKAGYTDEGGVKTLTISNVVEAIYEVTDTETKAVFTCSDGQQDFRALPISLSFTKGISVSTVLTSILDIIPLTVARIPQIPISDYQAGYSFVGRAFDALSEVLARVGLGYTVQNNQIYILQVGDTIEPTAFVISPESGLINSPVELSDTTEQTGVPEDKKKYRVNTLLNPSLLPGSYVELRSKIATGFFKVEDIKHYGDNWEDTFESIMEVIQL